MRVSPSTQYTPEQTYGWTSGTIASADRKTGTALDRDLNLTAKGTFVADVPNGTYRVDVRLGDAGKTRHDQMGLSLEGVPLDAVTTEAGQLVWQSYTVKVTDGQLSLDLLDLGGSDKHVAIAGLTVVPAADDSSHPTVTISRRGADGRAGDRHAAAAGRGVQRAGERLYRRRSDARLVRPGGSDEDSHRPRHDVPGGRDAAWPATAR